MGKQSTQTLGSGDVTSHAAEQQSLAASHCCPICWQAPVRQMPSPQNPEQQASVVQLWPMLAHGAGRHSPSPQTDVQHSFALVHAFGATLQDFFFFFFLRLPFAFASAPVTPNSEVSAPVTVRPRARPRRDSVSVRERSRISRRSASMDDLLARMWVACGPSEHGLSRRPAHRQCVQCGTGNVCNQGNETAGTVSRIAAVIRVTSRWGGGSLR